MTERELSDKWLKSIHYHFEKRGNGRDDLAPILPFIVLDIYYSYFTKWLMKGDFKQRQRQMLVLASKAYNRLNQKFFSAYEVDEWDDVVALMDSLEESANNQVKITEVAAWNLFKDHPQCDVLVAAFMCNSLARAAQAIWRTVYRDEKGHPIANKEIDTMLFSMKAFADCIKDGSTSSNHKAIENLLKAENSLGRKIVRWMAEDKEVLQ